MKRKLKVNDFFCGCGGMGIAFKNAGYEIAGAWDFDKYAVESYRANVGDHVQKADIKELHQADIPQADVWAFGFPCQDLSVAGKQRGMILKCEDCGEEIEINPEEYTGNTICPKCSSNNFKAASRSGCFFEMMRLLEETEREREHAMPTVIIAENVRGLRPYLPVLRLEYERHGYTAHIEMFNSKYWNVPQNRDRYAVVGTRNKKNLSFTFPKEQHEFVPKLSDYLEKDVPEKYYLPDEKAQTIIAQAMEKLEKMGKCHACITPDRINKRQKDEKGMVIKNDYLARLLSLRPCPEMSTYDFLYRIAVDLVYTSNSFSVIFWNKDFTRVESIQPITTTSYRIFEDDKNNILFRFRWDYDGKMYTVPYQNVIHVKARYNKRRFLGTTPDMELKRSLDLIETSGETIKNIVNRSNSLAGYLKYNNIADDEELKEIARNFQDAYMNKDNAGGIAAIDNTVEFKEISQRTPSIPTNQITFLRDNIYRYYGVNDKILTSTLNDTEFISFYENVIEPISVQLSYEFTFKLLTPREIGYGNRIDFVANLLQYATLQTRETIGGGMFDRGALTINEYRELMYYGPVEDGDQRLVSLNYVKVGDQSLYQVGQQNEPPDDTGANDREKRAMQAAARAYMQIMKGG